MPNSLVFRTDTIDEAANDLLEFGIHFFERLGLVGQRLGVVELFLARLLMRFDQPFPFPDERRFRTEAFLPRIRASPAVRIEGILPLVLRARRALENQGLLDVVVIEVDRILLGRIDLDSIIFHW